MVISSAGSHLSRYSLVPLYSNLPGSTRDSSIYSPIGCKGQQRSQPLSAGLCRILPRSHGGSPDVAATSVSSSRALGPMGGLVAAHLLQSFNVPVEKVVGIYDGVDIKVRTSRGHKRIA
jgi:hypothetical protein